MQEYFYIQEKLEHLQIEDRLKKLSKQFEGKKVVLFGANNALEAICAKYDLKSYFSFAFAFVFIVLLIFFN